MRMRTKIKSDYLKRLPEEAQTRGDADSGEVEIVTNQKDIARIEADSEDELTGSAFGEKNSLSWNDQAGFRSDVGPSRNISGRARHAR
jgi:hypothetical protein